MLPATVCALALFAFDLAHSTHSLDAAGMEDVTPARVATAVHLSGSSSSTFAAGFRWASSSFPTDQSRPRAIRSRYRGSATVSLLWPSVVENTLAFPL